MSATLLGRDPTGTPLGQDLTREAIPSSPVLRGVAWWAEQASRPHQRLQVLEASTGETMVSHLTLRLFIIHSTLAWLRSKRSLGAPASAMKSLSWAMKTVTQ